MNNRDAIIEAALLLFTSFGYEAAGTQDICEEAGITKPTMYHYFKSKRGLMEAIMRENFQPFLLRLKDACDYRFDLALNIEQIMRSYFRFAESNMIFYKLQLSMRNAPARSESFDIIKPWLKAQFDPIQAMFIQAEKQHGNMQGRSRAFTITLLGMINAYVQQAFEEGLSLSDELLYQARQQFMYGIFS